MAELMAAVAQLVNEPDEPARSGVVLSMRLYCWPHRTAHTLAVEDVEVLVYSLGAMVVDGYQLGDDDVRHAPDCYLDVIRLGTNPEGYAEHTEQGQLCRDAEPAPNGEHSMPLPSGDQLDAERAGRVTVEACPECRQGKHQNCTGVAFDSLDRQVPCPCSICARGRG